MGVKADDPLAPGRGVIWWGGFLTAIFVIAEVNYPNLGPQTQLALLALFGISAVFMPGDRHERGRAINLLFLSGSVLTFLYVVIQSEPVFQRLWLDGQSLGNRAGHENRWDILVGVIGLIVVIEATRRAIGWTLPVLTLLFIAYAYFGPYLSSWLLPHRGYGLSRIVSQGFLQSQGVFGLALTVMFVYVFLFLVFGSLLEATGATRFIFAFTARVFSRTRGAPAKISVLSSGMMGSLSGSAVANTATTGAFTIPLMRSSGFPAHVAAGVEAAASSGGALAPPVMGAAAYMMLEIVQPPVSYLEIIRAAAVPAILYYLSLLLIVHFRSSSVSVKKVDLGPKKIGWVEGVVFFAALGSLILLLVAGYTPFRAVSWSLLVVVGVSLFSRDTRAGPGVLAEVLVRAAHNAVPLICAASCVGIIIGVVTLTGLGAKLPSLLLPLASESLLAALVILMVSSIVLGMGLPSVVCYLLLATFVGPALGKLGVVPLAAHLFIFYFGMMSMVTPPVALAAYTAAGIAKAPMLRSSWSAFRIAGVGFVLPYLFVYRPQLLLLSTDGSALSIVEALPVICLTSLGLIPLTGAVTGYFPEKLPIWMRLLLLGAALLCLLPLSGNWVWAGWLLTPLVIGAVYIRALGVKPGGTQAN